MMLGCLDKEVLVVGVGVGVVRGAGGGPGVGSDPEEPAVEATL